MSKSRIATIEAWFQDKDDGEFCVYPADHKSVLTGDHAVARTIIYTTKRHCLRKIDGLALESPIATIGRGGLPVIEDLALLRYQVGTVNRVFIGDADPPDILVFSWLREHVPILWHGVNDDFLMRHGKLPEPCIKIPMSDSERETVQKLQEFCPDFRELLGQYCASSLDQGFKIELEGAIIDRYDSLCD